MKVLTYDGSVDSFGQFRQQVPSERPLEMIVHNYRHSLTDDIRYANVELIGLTYDREITDKNAIEIDGDIYDVVHVIPSKRYQTIFLRKTDGSHSS